MGSAKTPMVAGGDARPPATHSRSAALLRFFRTLGSGHVPRFECSRLFLQPFNVNAEELNEIRRTSLALLDDVLDVVPDFAGVVRFTDLSTRKYDNYDSLIGNSANDREPERLTLNWSVFSLSSDGQPISGEIEIIFTTEKMLEDQESGPGEFARSSVQLSVRGSGEEWVAGAFSRLDPFVRATNVSMWFRWMNIFRNAWFIELLRSFLALAGFAIGTYLATTYIQAYIAGEKQIALKKIISADNIAERFNRFVVYYFNPQESGFFLAFLPLIAGFVFYIILYVAGMKIIPLLAPSSSVGIGLTGKFRRDVRNLWRFIILDVIILSIIIPICLAILL